MNKAQRKAAAATYTPPLDGPTPPAVFSGPWSMQATGCGQRVFVTCAGHSGFIELTAGESGFEVCILNGHPIDPIVRATASATYAELETSIEDDE